MRFFSSDFFNTEDSSPVSEVCFTSFTNILVFPPMPKYAGARVLIDGDMRGYLSAVEHLRFVLPLAKHKITILSPDQETVRDINQMRWFKAQAEKSQDEISRIASIFYTDLDLLIQKTAGALKARNAFLSKDSWAESPALIVTGLLFQSAAYWARNLANEFKHKNGSNISDEQLRILATNLLSTYLKDIEKSEVFKTLKNSDLFTTFDTP